MLKIAEAKDKLTKENHVVDICMMCTQARARKNRPNDAGLDSDIDACISLLGARNLYSGSFPNIEMNTTPHIELVQFIEQSILKSKPDIVITHHPSDTNNDHFQTSIACQAAARLFQRRDDVKPVSELWYMEIPSSTEWSVNTSMNRFQPNTFVEVGEAGVSAKLVALSQYRGVMREYPHPRSNEAIRAFAAFRGSQSGLIYAEAFECVFRRLK